jgi:hypothetical protein
VILGSKSTRGRGQRNRRDETNETIDDINRKKSAGKPIINETPTGTTAMLKPTFRFFIIPLGAICTLASLSGQNAAPRAQGIPARCWSASR